ncbi:MAG: hypothetical protein H0X25_12220 [Acidobacteriales bacterium]|nr:hypothetical protein [Terriglobales bacterium]
MSTSMVPMLAPDGTAGYIPHEKVQDALKEGGRVGVEILSPDGRTGVIPQEHA